MTEAARQTSGTSTLSEDRFTIFDTLPGEGATRVREYLILGVMEVRCDGVPVDLGSPKQRAVLAALVLARGAVVSTDRLIDAVWGTAPPPAALTSLQAYVSNLRRALRGGGADPSSIERVNPGYRLDVTGDRVDLADFTQRAYAARQASAAGDWPAALAESEAALSLWRGPLLAEFGDEDWVAVEAAALAESLNAVRDAHIGALLAHDDTAGALAEIQVLRADEPLRDRGVWLQMVSLHRAGRTTEALDTYATHVRALADELGLDPGVELRELHAAILRHDPAIAGWPQPPSGARAVAAPAQPTARVAEHPADTALDPRPLVGRVDECAALAACFRGTMPTASRWVVLQGPAGIGKSRLAEEAARYATDAGERAIWVRCPDVEGIPAWWPMRQLCRALDVSATELLSMPGGADADTARFVIYERLQHLVEQAAALGPLTVIVDDAQWADSMSLGFLTYLTGVVRDVPICLIVTVRDDEGNADVDRLRVAMNRADGLIIDVPRLATDEVAALVRQIADDDITDVAARALADRTGGNPLFVSEYARLPNDQRLGQVTPAVVRSVLDRRLAALDPGVLEVVAHAAVLGEVVDPPVLAEVMGRDVESIMDCLDEAADEHILIASPMRGGTGFAHALLREQAVSTIRPLRRARIHARAADVLGGPGLPDAVARRAAHLLAAVGVVEPQVIVHACRAAADEATAQWDSPNAAYWLESALATYESLPATEFVLSERDSLLLDLLEALSRAGRAQSVLEMVEDRLEQAVRHGSTATIGRLASALVRSGGGWPWMAPWGGPGRLHTVLATAEVAAADDPSSRARVLAALAIGHCYHHDASVPAGLLDEAELLSVTVGDPDVTADVLLARMITYSGVADHVDEAFAVAERLATLDHQQAPVDRVIADSVLTMALMMAGNIVATEVHLRRGIVGSERLKLPILRAQLRWMELTLAVWRGEFDLASEHYRVAVAVHEETELYVAGSGAIAMMALAAEQGLLDQVVDTADVDPVSWARSMTAQFQDNDVALLLCSGIAVIAGRAGDRELATTMVEVWLADERPMVWTSLAQAVLLAHVVADLGMTVYAQRFVDYLMPFRHMVATVGQVGCVGPVGLALAELLIMLGRAEEAEPILDDVAVLAARTGGVPAALRVRLLQVLAQPPGPGRDRALGDIERTAAGIGLVQVAARAAARPVEETG